MQSTAAVSNMPKPVPQSTFAGAIDDASADVHALVARIESLAIALVGPADENGVEASAPLPAGVLPTAFYTARLISAATNRGLSALDRIAAALP